MSLEKNSEYWVERFSRLEEQKHISATNAYLESEKHIQKIQRDIEKDINDWYQRFADNNKIDMSDARKLLNSKEMEELRWTVQDYIKAGKNAGADPKYLKQLENASAKYHINRLESLKIQTECKLEEMFGGIEKNATKAIENAYRDGYYRTAYEVQKGTSVGSNIVAIDDKKLSTIVSKPWSPDGRDFSDNIWGKKNKMISALHDDLLRMCVTGTSPNKIISQFAERTGATKRDAKRLINTESAFFASAARQQCFNDLDVEQYQVVATLDLKISSICQNLDGEVYEVKDYAVGVTAPPFHCNCRTTTCPHFNDEFSDTGMRAARGEDGKTMYVPADMTYKEWYDKFMKNNPDYGKKNKK